ncbi:hypothetical protein [Bacillus mycoides]|uniref:hypothetical protein n=1 Tax=Bacillus mycoides TaxID=1405 RepID=UPI0015D140D2|nr:hypothetical protein [Bacillus mycoides]
MIKFLILYSLLGSIGLSLKKMVKWNLEVIKQNSYLTTNKKSTFLYALLVR